MDLFEKWLFGYYVLKFKGKDAAKIASIALMRFIGAQVKPDGRVIVARRDLQGFLSSLGDGFEYSVSALLGLPAVLSKAIKHSGYMCAFVVGIVIYFISGMYVWDIRVEGNKNISDGAVLSELEDCGLYTGVLWKSFDLQNLEASVLERSDKIGWISIYREGTVAIVNVVEKENEDEIDGTTEGVFDIVAKCDAVIEQITVKRGVAVVKAGDVVRRGDLLISGVLDVNGEQKTVGAEGIVIGRAVENVVSEAERTQTVKEKGEERLVAVSLKIFKYTINIFENYRNSSSSCDIIEKTDKIVLLDKYRLPFAVSRLYSRSQGEMIVEYTDEELAELVSRMHRALLASTLATRDLVKISTTGTFTESGYRLTSKIVYSVDICQDMEISLHPSRSNEQ